MERQLARWCFREYTIERDDMKMYVEISRRFTALDERHGPGAPFADAEFARAAAVE